MASFSPILRLLIFKVGLTKKLMRPVVALNLNRPILSNIPEKKNASLSQFLGAFSALVARVPVLGIRMFFQYSRKQIQAYLDFWELSALGARCMCSRAWHSYAFPRLTPAVCFHALGNRCVFPRAWHPLYVFPRLTPVVCVFVMIGPF